MIFSFYLPTFQIYFLTDFLSFNPSHLNIIFHLFFLYSFPTIIFFNVKCYNHNIFRNTFTKSHQNLMWKVVTSSNLNPPLKLFFYSPILANNNLLLKIYCENILVAFLIFYIIFPFLISSIRFFFSLGFFSTIVTTHVSHSYLYLLFFFFF